MNIGELASPLSALVGGFLFRRTVERLNLNIMLMADNVTFPGNVLGERKTDSDWPGLHSAHADPAVGWL